MRHEDGRHALFVVQAAQPPAQLRADVRVKGAERLIEQQHARVDGEGAGERHPLPLAAGELRRALLGPVREPDDAEQLVDLRLHLVLRPLADPQTERDVLADAHVRERGVVLEHEADAPLLRTRGRDVDAVNRDRAGVRRLQPGDDPQQRRLARAAWSEQRSERALRDLQGHIFKRRELPEVLRDVVDVDPHQASSFRGASTVITSSTSRDRTASSVAAAYAPGMAPEPIWL